jgi:type I restriction enzyme, S subunit
VSVPWVPLGEVLRPAGEVVSVAADATYEMLGVRSFARGAFAADSLLGASTAYKQFRRVKANQVVYPKLMAWEGAFAVVPAHLDGRFVSPEFQCFDVGTSLASARYIAHVLAWPGFMESVRQGSAGTNVRRRRLQPSAFLRIPIPLPSLDRQEHIAAHLDLVAKGNEPQRVADAAEILQAGWVGDPVSVRDLVSPVVRSTQVSDRVYRLSGVKWYGQGLFVREHKPGREISSRTVREIRQGDLVYNRLFAWKQSFAIAASDGYASNEFPTFAINSDLVRPRVLLAALLSPSFTESVNRVSTGSTPTSRNRLKENDFLSLTVLLPPARQQPSIERSLLLADRIREVRSRRDTIAAAVLPAARHEIFASMV